MDCIQLVQNKGTGAGVSECGIESKGRKYLDKFSDCLHSVELIATANCTVVMLFGLTTALCVLFQYHVTLLWRSSPPQQPPKVVCFRRLIKNPSVEDLVGDGDA